jgi:hypothetical protein
MKKITLILCSLLLIGICQTQAQSQDKVVYLKKYDFDSSAGNDLYLSVEEGEEEVTAKKTGRPSDDEVFTLEYVKGEEYQYYCHIKNFNYAFLLMDLSIRLSWLIQDKGSIKPGV